MKDFCRVSEGDKLQAQILGLRCDEMFNEKSKALNYYQENNLMDVDDDEWGEDEDEEFDSDDDDDDWKNNVVEID